VGVGGFAMPSTLLSCYSCPWPMGSGTNCFYSVLFYFVEFIFFCFVCICVIR